MFSVMNALFRFSATIVISEKDSYGAAFYPPSSQIILLKGEHPTGRYEAVIQSHNTEHSAVPRVMQGIINEHRRLVFKC